MNLFKVTIVLPLFFLLSVGGFGRVASSLSIFDEYNLRTYDEFKSLMQAGGRTDDREIKTLFFESLKARGYDIWNRFLDILQIEDQEEKVGLLKEWQKEWATTYSSGVGSLRTINPYVIKTLLQYEKKSEEGTLYKWLICYRPDYSKLPYTKRFMRSEDALAYLVNKLDIYSKYSDRLKEIQQKILSLREKSIEIIGSPEDTVDEEKKQKFFRDCDLYARLKRIRAEEIERKIQKWQARQAFLEGQDWRRSPIYPEIYKSLGFEFLHQRGLSGDSAIIGVLDSGKPLSDPLPSSPYAVHDLLPAEIFVEGSDIPCDHSISTIGVVARRQELVDEPPAVAPGAKIYLRTPKNISLTYHVRYHPQLLGQGKVEKEETIIEGAKALNERFASLSREFPRLKPFIITKTEVNPRYDQSLATIIDEFIMRGIKLVYSSIALSIGEKTYQSLIKFKQMGGILIKSAGNDNYAITPDKRNIFKDINAAENLSLYWRLIEDPELAEVFLLAGSLKEVDAMSDFSTKAGVLSHRYLSAFGDSNLLLAQDRRLPNAFKEKGWVHTNSLRRQKEGTSFAAPMIAGGIALLMEAFPERLYPQCTPQFIGQVLLEAASPIQKVEIVNHEARDETAHPQAMSQGVIKSALEWVLRLFYRTKSVKELQEVLSPHNPWISGRGAMNLKAAFERLTRECSSPLSILDEFAEEESFSSSDPGPSSVSTSTSRGGERLPPVFSSPRSRRQDLPLIGMTGPSCTTLLTPKV